MAFGPTGALALSWILTTISIVLSIGRYYIRYRAIKGVDLSDLFHRIGLLLLVFITINLTFVFSAAGQRLVENNEETFLRLRAAVSCLWLASLYSIKLSFLLFYRSIFRISVTFMRVWWLITAFTFVAFWASFGITIAQGGRQPQTNNEFDNLPGVNSFLIVHLGIGVICVFNVLSDLAIMALPLYMLRGLQIPLRQKLGLAVLFSLAILSVGFDIGRTIVNVYGEGASFPYIGRLLNIVEVELVVIVSTLIPYRSLLRRRGKSNSPSERNQFPQELLKDTNAALSTSGSQEHLTTLP